MPRFSSPAYSETIAWLVGLEVSRGWDLKLETVRAALDRLGSPERRFPSLHVAGTNGKGSVAAIAASVLAAGGVRAGLYTSPHLEDFRERIRVGGQPIAAADVVALVDEVRESLRGSGVELTFFEITTVVAFLHFARAEVETAVVEVGLGGRLDATNVLVPRASVITTIARDHERFLGSTLAGIAAEKGGILKPGVPAVLGRIDGEALATLEGIAMREGCPLRRLGRDFHVRAGDDGTFSWTGRRAIEGLRCGLAGEFQLDNAAVALAALEDGGWLAPLSDDEIRRGLAAVRWPGRLEVVSRDPRVVLDGAHNPAGVAALARELPRLFPEAKPRLVFGVLADKRWEEMVEGLAPLVSEAVIVPVRELRSERPERIAGAFARRVLTRVADSGVAAVERLLDEGNAPILVAGSLFLVGEVRSRFSDDEVR